MARRPRHEFNYVVVLGEGSFPLDMLRYDSCVPATASQAHKLTDDIMAAVRVVVLRRWNCQSDGRPQWETRRWASFGWTIIDDLDHNGWSENYGMDINLSRWEGAVIKKRGPEELPGFDIYDPGPEGKCFFDFATIKRARTEARK